MYFKVVLLVAGGPDGAATPMSIEDAPFRQRHFRNVIDPRPALTVGL